MNLEKIGRKTKTILLLEGVFVMGVIIYLLMMKPTAIAPLSGNVISEGEFSFQFQNAQKIMIARDKEFQNQMDFDKDSTIKLPPGTYYWKIKSWFRESEVMNFTVANKVSLRIDEKNNTLSIYNVGTSDIKIKILEGETVFINKTIISGHFVEENVSGKIIVEGEQK